MPLTAGTRLGSYEVINSIGAGGMGEVYRAHDTKLGRDVAIKIVSDGFAHDPERVARFKREAQILAALNHPHIAAIYGLEEANGSQFLVLELVEGPTLAERLRAVASDLSVASDFSRTRSSPAEAGRHVQGGRLHPRPRVYARGQRLRLSRARRRERGERGWGPASS